MVLNFPGSSQDAQLTLTLTRPADVQAAALRRTAAVASRVLRMDTGAMARVVQVGDEMSDVIFSTPLGCIVAERIHAVPSVPDAVVLAEPVPRLLAGVVESPTRGTVSLGGVVSLLWTGTAPPATGFRLIDTVPAADVRSLFEGMQREADEHSGPAGLPPSLLDQPLLRLTGDADDAGAVEIAGRVVAALGALGLVVEPRREDLRAHDLIRVSATGSWIRIDALFGTAYVPRPGGLARIPSPR
ncbi:MULTISPECIES: hypothetical protein [unclassified Corynebacterium]|uniref:hypothetical protein n=1 Tax=unclassified Corynebacterium TaxID=2624378 RepID=UPI0026473118|nr:hypothetical protein [Corynebacterium sp.]MDN5719239.1 hypothetical protein [Corynebacterium sp.]